MTLTSEQRLRRANRSLLAVLALLGTAVSMSFLDRRIALWSHHVFAGTSTFTAASFVLSQLDHIGMVGGILLVAALIAWIAKRSGPDWIKRYVIAATSALVAIAITELLKWACGRSSPYPLFIENHIYAFRPFSGKPDYMDFPSGTLTVTLGFITGWRPREIVERVVAWLVTAVFALSLLFANGHWVSDMITGALVGWSVGLAMPMVFRQTGRSPVARSESLSS